MNILLDQIKYSTNMSLQVQTVKSASDAWKLLKGLVCIYKPSEYPLGSFIARLKRNLVEDLNEMQRSIESNYTHPINTNFIDRNSDMTENHTNELDKYESDMTELISPDYSRHPLVLGKGI